MFWMGPGRRGGLFMLPGIAALVTGTILLSGISWLEGASDALSHVEGKESVVYAYVDGKPVKSFVLHE